MTMDLVAARSVAKAKETGLTAFLWRDRAGEFHRIDRMETRHLFFTLRMIWNNHMPRDARVGDVRLYSFAPYYTPSYFRDAIAAILPELRGRNDIRREWMRQIEQMFAYFNNANRIQSDAPLRVSAAQ